MAWYSTGTAAITQGSTSVQGAGTNWINQQPGWAMMIEGVPGLVEIAAVVSSTELRAAKPINAQTASGLAYAILPTQGLTQKLVEDINKMIAEITNSRVAWTSVFSNFSMTAYQIWLDQGNVGTAADFLLSLKGDKGDRGDTGPSVYDQWLDQGNTGTFDQFLDVLSDGAIAAAAEARDGAQDAQGAAEAAQQGAEAAKDGATTAQSEVDALAVQVAADRAAVAQIFDTFDDRYLGAKDSDPAVDNDGDPLLVGAVYWNRTTGGARFWNGAEWEAPSASAASSAQQAIDAKLAAIAAQAAAETARDEAQGFATAAADSAAGAVTAQGGAEGARDEAVSAQEAVAIDKAAVSGMRDQVATDKGAVLVAKGQAETARDETLSALQAARDDLGLQPVATSGDYNDLINTPQQINPIAMAIVFGG